MSPSKKLYLHPRHTKRNSIYQTRPVRVFLVYVFRMRRFTVSAQAINRPPYRTVSSARPGKRPNWRASTHSKVPSRKKRTFCRVLLLICRDGLVFSLVCGDISIIETIVNSYAELVLAFSLCSLSAASYMKDNTQASLAASFSPIMPGYAKNRSCVSFAARSLRLPFGPC